MSEGLVQLGRRNPPASSGEGGSATPVAAPGAPRLYIETYGCQMNAADTDLIAGLFARGGWARAELPADADVILMNTCAVREKAEEKVFARAGELRALKRKKPGTVLAITGCMAEHLKDKLLERAPWVDVVAGPDSYRRLEAAVTRARQDLLDHDVRAEAKIDVRLDRNETYEGLDPVHGGDGISGFVSIQRGCDKFCTFCVVPYTRGRERGSSPREVLRQVRALAEAGYKEVTLLGQTVNSYRWEDVRFSDLLRAVARVDGIERVRFTSPYPVDFTPDVIAAIAEEARVCKHVHLPLQSASDAVLGRMRRGYTIAEYARLYADLRLAAPDIAITTDVLVGFSGETDADHVATVEFMADARFDAAFMFAYSEREGTLAARKLPDDVPEDLKKRRLAEVIALQEKISAAANAAFVGRTLPVMLHKASKRDAEQLVGRTDHFRAVIVARGEHRPGDLVNVKIDRSTGATLFGEVV
jgi:tRNA-2-methylthio-N6-dimethylallyladenosine synthase